MDMWSPDDSGEPRQAESGAASGGSHPRMPVHGWRGGVSGVVPLVSLVLRRSACGSYRVEGGQGRCGRRSSWSRRRRSRLFIHRRA